MKKLFEDAGLDWARSALYVCYDKSSIDINNNTLLLILAIVFDYPLM
jgi:hypothetical protein